jgi:hypothetical protein
MSFISTISTVNIGSTWKSGLTGIIMGTKMSVYTGGPPITSLVLASLMVRCWKPYGQSSIRFSDENSFWTEILDDHMNDNNWNRNNHGHKDECLYWWATNYIPGAGVIDGEVLETLWSVLNKV